MSEAENQLPEDPKQAEPGRGAPGNDHYGVQTAQTLAVNAPEAIIPSDANPEESIEQVKAQAAQEEGTGLRTTDGFFVDESGRLDNVAVEPPMYYDE